MIEIHNASSYVYPSDCHGCGASESASHMLKVGGGLPFKLIKFCPACFDVLVDTVNRAYLNDEDNRAAVIGAIPS